ncbi:hypothetical protein CC86DRAFT_402625 [Ophiobolus disseminans]|uniref:Uncharacterized protein n=1 Tax=Ophiobolus disseminans TaxID=1469910 RepID=A0A6A7ABS8_9PLEO|nr:hypothetical protein CC86DRAFT_402625 [Ophiobolus disseminans]
MPCSLRIPFVPQTRPFAAPHATSSAPPLSLLLIPIHTPHIPHPKIFSNLAFHGKPAPADDSAQPQDKKSLALRDTMANWEVDSMADLIPASISPLVKKSFGEGSFGTIAARTTIEETDAPVFAPPEEWSMQVVQKLHLLSQMTRGDIPWAHRVLERCVFERHQGMKGATVGTKVREVMPADVRGAIAEDGGARMFTLRHGIEIMGFMVLCVPPARTIELQ